ncbi:unnamed protein product [Choristocarpus tenellus]
MGEEGEGDGIGVEGQREDEKNRENELKEARRAKKKAKLKALKAKLKEKKRAWTEGEKSSRQPGEGSGTRAERTGAGGVGEEDARELWVQFCKVQGEAVTPLERDNPWVRAESLAHVEGFGAHTLPKLAGFIKASVVEWKSKLSKDAARGSPTVLVVCSGARRCVKVIKALTAFRCQVLKLFAKHLKMDEQKTMLRKACFPLAVGTPGRMRQLANLGALQLSSATLVVLDLEKDIKGRTVLNMEGVAQEMMGLLAEYIRPKLVPYGKGKLRLAMY